MSNLLQTVLLRIAEFRGAIAPMHPGHLRTLAAPLRTMPKLDTLVFTLIQEVKGKPDLPAPILRIPLILTLLRGRLPKHLRDKVILTTRPEVKTDAERQAFLEASITAAWKAKVNPNTEVQLSPHATMSLAVDGIPSLARKRLQSPAVSPGSSETLLIKPRPNSIGEGPAPSYHQMLADLRKLGVTVTLFPNTHPKQPPSSRLNRDLVHPSRARMLASSQGKQAPLYLRSELPLAQALAKMREDNKRFIANGGQLPQWQQARNAWKAKQVLQRMSTTQLPTLDLFRPLS